MRRLIVLTAAALVLTACQPPAPREGGGDAGPSRDIAADFQAWEQGRRDGVFAPLMIEFEDRDSPMVQTELGESRSGRDRILPTRYRVTNARVVFEGRSERLGPVRLQGDLDAGRLAESKRNLGDEAPVLTGTLTVGGRGYPVRMRWWAGD